MFAVEHTGDAGQEEQHEQPSIRGDYAEPHDGYRYRERTAARGCRAGYLL
jgi:hypothetical protein